MALDTENLSLPKKRRIVAQAAPRAAAMRAYRSAITRKFNVFPKGIA